MKLNNLLEECLKLNLLKIKLEKGEFNACFFTERLNYIMKNANRLRRYINNLIDVSKLEMGYMDANFTNENIVEVVEDISEDVKEEDDFDYFDGYHNNCFS